MNKVLALSAQPLFLFTQVWNPKQCSFVNIVNCRSSISLKEKSPVQQSRDSLTSLLFPSHPSSLKSRHLTLAVSEDFASSHGTCCLPPEVKPSLDLEMQGGIFWMDNLDFSGAGAAERGLGVCHLQGHTAGPCFAPRGLLQGPWKARGHPSLSHCFRVGKR